MPSNSYPTNEKLTFLLGSIFNREVALPDFQRDFVWDPHATEELIESISQNYPAGSLLRIRNGVGFAFAPRAFAGSPELNSHAPSYLILDGQQRLTSLYQAFYGAGTHRYFVDLGGLIKGEDLEDCVFYLKKSQADKRFPTLQKQAAALTFPLEALFGGEGFEDWLDAVVQLRTDLDEKDLRKQLRKAWKTALKPIEDYEFPMVTLADDTSPAAVCTIFETLNRTGVKLSVFDLLAARFWSNGLRLRDLWDTARQDQDILVDFAVDPYYVLQAVALTTAKGAPSCKRSDVLDMNAGQIQQGWDSVIKGLAEILHLLRDECGVAVQKWLPSVQLLVPAAAIMAATAGATGPAVASRRAKMKRWFWCSVFGQTYDKGPNSQAVRDFAEAVAWIKGGAEPETVHDFTFDISDLRQVTQKQRALYSGVIALILSHGALDFHKASLITSTLIRTDEIDDHHIFPQKHLSSIFPPVQDTLRDCILNRTLIDKDTNIRIGKRAPSDYLAEIEKETGTASLVHVLRSHLLPVTSPSGLLDDDFACFLDQRQALIASELDRVTK